MIPGMNPKQMQKMMKQMGVQQDELPVVHAQLVFSDGTKLLFEQPQVTKVNMMGQETYQLIGTPVREEASQHITITDEDLETVIEQTGCSMEEAKQALEETNGDLAEAILNLSEQ